MSTWNVVMICWTGSKANMNIFNEEYISWWRGFKNQISVGSDKCKMSCVILGFPIKMK